MRLINTTTLEMAEFVDSETMAKKYAILSHRWGAEEVTFKEYQKRRPETVHRQGYKKVVTFCEKAKERRYEWAWVDTICIDKRSSAELSESINSMYEFYENSGLCMVHLADVSLPQMTHDFQQCQRQLPSLAPCAECSAVLLMLQSSSWFERGWTLQELIAPWTIDFFDASWRRLGLVNNYVFKDDPFVAEISKACEIPASILVHQRSIFEESIAARFKYAAKRRTTRLEDSAYCLLGILGINMPLLYGEGQHAWRRLQEEVIRTSNDESIFIWKDDLNRTGMLAPALSCFAKADPIITRGRYGRTLRPTYSLTNQGLEWKLNEASGVYLHRLFSNIEHSFLVVPMECRSTDYQRRWCLVLKKAICGHFTRVATILWLPTLRSTNDNEIRLEKFTGKETVYVHLSGPGRSSFEFDCRTPNVPGLRTHVAESLVVFAMRSLEEARIPSQVTIAHQ